MIETQDARPPHWFAGLPKSLESKSRFTPSREDAKGLDTKAFRQPKPLDVALGIDWNGGDFVVRGPLAVLSSDKL